MVILVEKVNFQFVDPKSILDLLKCILDIFDRKTEGSIFLTKNRFLTSGAHFYSFLVEKVNFRFFDQKSICGLWRQFLIIFGRKSWLSIFEPKIDMWPLESVFGNIWSKNLTFDFWIKNRYAVSWVHFWWFFVEKVNFQSFDQKSFCYLNLYFWTFLVEKPNLFWI